MILKFLALSLLACQVASQGIITTDRPSEDAALPLLGGKVPVVDEIRLAEWVAKWQKRLGLTEWRITARIVRKKNLSKGLIANITWNTARKSATLRVIDERDSPLQSHAFARDTELSVVHELTHLSLHKLALSSPQMHVDEEEAVKKISQALMELEERRDARVLITAR